MFLVEVARISWVFNLRFIRSLALAFHHCVPVNVLEELVPHDELRVSETLIRVFLEEKADDVLDDRSVKFLPSNFVLLNSPEELFSICAVEGRNSSYHFVQEHSKAPPVTLLSVLSLLCQDLRRQILRCATEAISTMRISHVFLRKTKISEKCIAVGIDQNIFWFQTNMK